MRCCWLCSGGRLALRNAEGSKAGWRKGERKSSDVWLDLGRATWRETALIWPWRVDETALLFVRRLPCFVSAAIMCWCYAHICLGGRSPIRNASRGYTLMSRAVSEVARVLSGRWYTAREAESGLNPPRLDSQTMTQPLTTSTLPQTHQLHALQEGITSIYAFERYERDDRRNESRSCKSSSSDLAVGSCQRPCHCSCRKSYCEEYALKRSDSWNYD
jgi:hypothetical protein